MNRIIDIRDTFGFDSAIDESIRILQSGHLFVYPTDTIYGIGSDIYDEGALEKIAKIKGREDFQPYIILVSSFNMLDEFAHTDVLSKEILEKYWPGPLTVILKSKIKLSKYVDNGLGKIAVRMPDNKFCLELISKYKKPITSTSANLHSQPQGSFSQVVDDFKDHIDLFVFNGEAVSYQPSTIIDLTTGKLKVIRKGAIEDFS